ncbi:helix-turn-helix transcriptional regulator [Solimonas marina]|uniref:YafY family transcriptional regulator n=1 Tax=Solimonas marina TaxID=2714601 RepID=A0A970B9J2_9GAMM|nr:YafY family protein [Solimonas marina]NKF23394.1 YafY family transcriptional regulator [Solimonas marina]
MRRADRLFQIVQFLRGRRRTTAAQLAGWLQVSERTIYRDVRDLTLTGVPIEGEAGVGYRLAPHFELPPLMFTREEIESLAAGLRMLQTWGSPELQRGVASVWAKLAAALPERERVALERTPLYAPRIGEPLTAQTAAYIDRLRAAIAARDVLDLDYGDERGRRTQRRVWPLGLFFWGGSWLLGAWCELRGDFRNFRVDRIGGADATGIVYPDQSGRRLEDFVRAMRDS